MYCHCRICKKMRRKGKILGGRRMGYWLKNLDGSYTYCVSSVSDYVAFPRFAKGRVRKERNVNHFEDN